MNDAQIAEYREVFSRRLAKAIREFKPDVIHSHHLFLLNSLIKEIAPQIPLVCTSHGTEEKMLAGNPALLSLAAPGAKAAERVIAVSEAIKAQAAELFGMEPDRIACIGNGYDDVLFHPRKLERGRVLDKYVVTTRFDKTVLYVGKFSEWKGVEYLIRAAKHYTGESGPLTLICGNGSDELRGRYNALIHSLGLENSVKMITPPDNRSDLIAEIMACGDAFVLPSIENGTSVPLITGCSVNVDKSSRYQVISNTPHGTITPSTDFIFSAMRSESGTPRR